MTSVVTHMLPAHGLLPNCSICKCPLLLYKRAFDPQKHKDLASHIEETFASHGYDPQWRYRMYDRSHYHSTSHEVLGVFRGTARLRFGGDEVDVQEVVEPGDVIAIPAGVAHNSLEAGADFQMVGAYPAGKSWDMCYGQCQKEHEQALVNISKLSVPPQDPVTGSSGPLLEHWHS